MGYVKREHGKQDLQGGRKWEKQGGNTPHCIIFCNLKREKRQEPTKGVGSGIYP